MTNTTRTCSITASSLIRQEMLALPINETLADYFELSPNVARGGMGTVYFCRDKRDKQFYALKTYKTTDPKFKELFLKEAQFALGLEKHPNVVYTRTVAMEGHTYYMVMDLVSLQQPKSITDEVKGNTLAQELAHKIPLEQALKWAVDLCHGMEYLNRKGMVAHGDLKPSNLFITSDKVLKVGDFGTVVLEGEKRKGGTLRYSSPEFEKGKKLDVRSDIYSFGIILYEMLNGGLNLLYPTRIGDKDKKYYQCLERKSIQKSPCAAIIAKCLEKDPKNRYQNFNQLSKVLQKKARKLRITLHISHAVSRPMEAIDYFFKGLGFGEMKLAHQSIINYNKSIRLLPYWSTYNNRGNQKADIKKYRQAIRDYTKAIDLNPKYAIAYCGRGKAHFELEQFSKSLQDYNKAIKLNSHYALAYNNRGLLYARLGKYSMALKDYDKAIQLNPNYATVYYNRGYLMDDLGQYKQAISDYTQSIKLNPLSEETYYNRAISYQAIGLHQKAIEDYSKSIRLNNKYEYAYCNRGNAKLNLGYLKEALEDYTLSLQLDKKDSYAYHNRGLAYERLKKYKYALADYTYAIKLDKKYKLAYLHRGRVYWRLKQWSKSLRDFKKVLLLDQDNYEALSYLLQIYRKLKNYQKATKIQGYLEALQFLNSRKGTQKPPSGVNPNGDICLKSKTKIRCV